ncbi:tyrosine recombinase XerC [Haloferula sp. A504]|uniref:tyrosine recombinase XerC n=1 Tax=Haloferula sp. A504 TaxID=3373601 RepID=UPI0031C956AB|nr:site-specific integrase [Verrucomicrobiaceae bacterium E54]
MPAKKKVRIETTREGYLVTVGNESKTLPSRTLAEAWGKIQTAPATKHVRYQFNHEERRPFIVAFPEISASGRSATKRKKFPTFAAALKFAEERDIAVENHGRSFTSELSRDEVAAVTAWRREAARLREGDVAVPSLADTLRESLARLTARPDGRKLTPELVEEFIAHKLDHGIGERQLADYKGRLARFREAFADRFAASVTPDEIERWLTSLTRRDGKRQSPQSRRNHRATLHAFFNWLLPEANPVAKVAVPRVHEPERDHYAPEEAKRFLAHLREHERDLVAPVVLSLFCGLRSSEIKRIDLGSIDLSNPDDEGEFILKANQTKTRRARAVPLPPAAKHWLTDQPLRSGPPIRCDRRKHDERLSAAFTAAGVSKVKNGFRHSFATYRGAIIRDSGRLADEMGNSAAVVARHYRDAKLEKEAKAFFAIRPGDEPEEAVPFAAAG